MDSQAVKELQLEIRQLEQLISSRLVEESRYSSDNKRIIESLNSSCQAVPFTLAREQIQMQTSLQLSQIKERHIGNMQYLESRIKNWQKTAQKYKMVYDRIRMERGILLSTEGGECYNHCKTVGQRVCLANDFSLEGSDCENFQGEDEIDDSEIDLMQSRLSATGPDVHYEMNVICKLECQQCKGMFKPYAYHRHLEHCQKENTAKALNLSITKPSRVSRCKSSRSKSPLSHYPQPELYRQLTSNARS